MYTTYTFPGDNHENLEWTFRPVAAPPESLHEKRLLHDYSMKFDVGYRRLTGVAGFQTDASFAGRRGLGRAIHLMIEHAEDWRTISGKVNKALGVPLPGQIHFSYDWEVGKEYRFRIGTGPSVAPERSRWIALWVTDVEMDSTVYVGEVLTPRGQTLIRSSLTVQSEDKHWWHTWEPDHALECEDFEPSAIAVLDVKLGDHASSEITAWTNGDSVHVFRNGHEAPICNSASVYVDGVDVQHNLGYWTTPPQNSLKEDG